MILDFPTIGNKRIVNNPDGSRIVELGETIIDYRDELEVEDFKVVTADMAGKPWSITRILYGTERYTPVFFFFNGYGNCYSVDEGDILLKFTIESMLAAVRDNNFINRELYNFSPEGTVGQSTNRDNTPSSKLPKIDQNRLRALRRLRDAAQGGDAQNNVISEELLQPNESDGTPTFEVSDGIITLGTDVSESRCKSDLSEVQTRTEQIRAAVLKKIQESS